MLRLPGHSGGTLILAHRLIEHTDQGLTFPSILTIQDRLFFYKVLHNSLDFLQKKKKLKKDYILKF